ncbi:MAG: UDP-N-acetylmuramoyl-tripeptide--D-alanyl-D-alanine ligase [Pseudomonadota bacterium]
MDSWLSMGEIAQMADGKLFGDNVNVGGVSTDTRNIKIGDLFVALQGERFDAHDFIDESVEQIAHGLLVHKQIKTDLPKIVVKDTLEGMSRFAKAWRKKIDPKLLAITGSNGKTTVKQMCHSILSRVGNTCFTHGNLNNHIGVPLTLLTLRQEHRYAVIEMGANHFGEIDHLSRLAEPDVAIINNAGPAHLEGFGSIEGVAHGKGEMINGVVDGGSIVLNADDKYLDVWLAKSSHLNVVTFGFSDNASVCGELEGNNLLTVKTSSEQFVVRLPVPGKHNAYNALAAIAATGVFGVNADDLRLGIENTTQETGRLQIKNALLGATVIDDTYNANPASLQAAIDVLCAQSKQPWLVLGDMGELGEDAESIHAQMGENAKAAGVKRLFGLGELSKHAVEKFGNNAFHFQDHQSLAKELIRQLNADSCILLCSKTLTTSSICMEREPFTKIQLSAFNCLISSLAND